MCLNFILKYIFVFVKEKPHLPCWQLMNPLFEPLCFSQFSANVILFQQRVLFKRFLQDLHACMRHLEPNKKNIVQSCINIDNCCHFSVVYRLLLSLLRILHRPFSISIVRLIILQVCVHLIKIGFCTKALCHI